MRCLGRAGDEGQTWRPALCMGASRNGGARGTLTVYGHHEGTVGHPPFMIIGVLASLREASIPWVRRDSSSPPPTAAKDNDYPRRYLTLGFRV